MNTPKISVLIPAYNEEKYIAECIDSILNQSFSDFECIIIDDGSTDSTWEILEQYEKKDSRIRIFKNETNLNIAATLNRGLDLAQAELVARMDADDWAYPDRLEKQYAFMQLHPEISISGGCVEEYETGTKWTTILDNEILHISLIFDSIFAHPTVIYKKSIVQNVGGYRINMPPVEDYDLWQRLSEKKDVKFANISDVLIRYRMHPERFQAERERRYLRIVKDIRRNAITHIMGEITEEEFLLHYAFCFPAQSNLFQVIFKFPYWMYRLHRGFVKAGYSSSIVRRTLIKKITYELRIKIAVCCKRYTITRILWNGMRDIKNYLSR